MSEHDKALEDYLAENPPCGCGQMVACEKHGLGRTPVEIDRPIIVPGIADPFHAVLRDGVLCVYDVDGDLALSLPGWTGLLAEGRLDSLVASVLAQLGGARVRGMRQGRERLRLELATLLGVDRG